MADTGLRYGRKLIYHTAAVADGDFSTASATDLGYLADGSQTDEPESETFATALGDVAAGVDVRHTYRVTGSDDLSTLQTAQKAMTEVYFFITSQDGESYTQIGPGIISSVTPTGSKYGTADRSGMIVVFHAKGGYPEDVYTDVASTVTLPS